MLLEWVTHSTLFCSGSVAANACTALTCLIFIRDMCSTNGCLLFDHHGWELFDYWEITKAKLEWIQSHKLMLWSLLLLSLLSGFLKLDINCRWYKWELLCWSSIKVVTIFDTNHTWLHVRISDYGFWLHWERSNRKACNFDNMFVHIELLVVCLLLSLDTILGHLWEAEISLQFFTSRNRQVDDWLLGRWLCWRNVGLWSIILFTVLPFNWCFCCWSANIEGKRGNWVVYGSSSELKLFYGLGCLMAALFEVAAVDFDLLEVNSLPFESLLGCGPVHQSLVKLFQGVNFKLIYGLLLKLSDQVILLLLVQLDWGRWAAMLLPWQFLFLVRVIIIVFLFLACTFPFQTNKDETLVIRWRGLYHGIWLHWLISRLVRGDLLRCWWCLLLNKGGCLFRGGLLPPTICQARYFCLLEWVTLWVFNRSLLLECDQSVLWWGVFNDRCTLSEHHAVGWFVEFDWLQERFALG